MAAKLSALEIGRSRWSAHDGALKKSFAPDFNDWRWPPDLKSFHAVLDAAFDTVIRQGRFMRQPVIDMGCRMVTVCDW